MNAKNPTTALLTIALLASAAAAANDCDHLKEANKKTNNAVVASWGAPGTQGVASYYLNGARGLRLYDLKTVQNAEALVATIKTDPITGDPVDCTAVGTALRDLEKPIKDLDPLYVTAIAACYGSAHALDGTCAKPANAVLDADLKYRTGALQSYYKAAKANPRICTQRLATLDQFSYAPCARTVNVGGTSDRLCSVKFIKLSNARDTLKGAVDEVNQVKNEPIRGVARQALGALNDSVSQFDALVKNLNTDNKTLFKAMINAAVGDDIVNSARLACNGMGSVDPSTYGSGTGGSGGGSSGGSSTGGPGTGAGPGGDDTKVE